MDDSISFRDGEVGSGPIVIPRLLFERIERSAARVGMTAVELIQLALGELFNDPLSLEALGNILRKMPEEM